MLKKLRDWRHAVVWRAAHWAWREFQRAGTVTAATPGGRAFREFGRRSVMAFPAGSVYGEHWITVGEGCVIGALVTMSAGMVPGQDLGPDPVLRIGDRCVIGRGSHIVAHADIRIGDDVWTGPYVYITDQNHGYEDPGTPIGRQMPVNSPVEIGAGSWLGAGAIVLPGARIGRHVVIAAGSVVRGDVPDYCVVAGVPAKVVRSYTEAGWGRPEGRPGRRPAEAEAQSTYLDFFLRSGRVMPLVCGSKGRPGGILRRPWAGRRDDHAAPGQCQ